MSDISQKLAKLTPAKRQLLLQKLAKKKEVDVFSQIQITPQSRESTHFPLSFAQQRLWFLDQLQPGNPAFNIFQPMRLTGKLNLEALKNSFNEVIRRHEILRTKFAIINGEPFQIITPKLEIDIPVIHLQQLATDKRETEVQRITHQEAQLPFNLAQTPLLRVTLLRLAETEHILLVTMHHIVSDGWSIGVLIRELNLLYEAFSQNRSNSLPNLPIQYADFAVWQRQWLQGEELETQIKYWQHQLGHQLPVLQLPTDYPRPAIQTFSGAKQVFSLPKATLEKLKSLNPQRGITLFMILLAAFQTLLHWYTEQEDIVVGTDIANRNRAETKDLLGFFVNQLVLRTNLSGNPTFTELLTRVREITLDAYAHQDLSFDKLVDLINPERRLNQAPLFQVKLILENTPSSSLNLRNLNISSIHFEKPTTQLDLVLEVTEREEGLVGGLEYNTDLFNKNTIIRMLTNFELVLNQVVQNPNIQLNNLIETLTQAEVNSTKQIKEEYKQKIKQIKRKVINAQNVETV